MSKNDYNLLSKTVLIIKLLNHVLLRILEEIV